MHIAEGLATQFRIGNYAYIDNEEHWGSLKGVPLVVVGVEQAVTKHFPKSNYSINLEHPTKPLTYSQLDEFVKPIPLTSYWVKRFGFRYNKEHHIWQLPVKGKKHHIILEWCEGEGSLWIDDAQVECEYVHTLQNIGFFLTTKELKIVESEQKS